MKVTRKNILILSLLLLVISYLIPFILGKLLAADGRIDNPIFNIPLRLIRVVLVGSIVILFLSAITRNKRLKVGGGAFFRILGQTFYVLLIVISSFLVLELTSSYVLTENSAYEKKHGDKVIRKAYPYIMFKAYQHDTARNKLINELGYFGKSPTAKKSNSEIRIFVLGGSTVFTGEPPIPQLLENEFYAHGFTNVRVFNYGITSSGSSQSLARVVFEIIDLQPDIIIAYNGYNDIYHPLDYDPRPGYPYNYLAFEKNNPLDYSLLSFVAYKSHLLRILLRNYFKDKYWKQTVLRKEANWLTEAWENEIISIYLKNLQKISIISQSCGAKFVAFFQPMAYYKEVLSKSEKRRISKYPGLAGQNPDYFIRMRNKIMEEYNLTDPGYDFMFRDISDIFKSDTSTIYSDIVHIHQQPKTIVTKKIFNIILNQFEDVFKLETQQHFTE
ncbi:MAG: SGNH/GDSL hydrolase family protein [Bacteroidia bacterium]|nr:SGNH/GDSL hydrolase family protein [Bacteroidia bacterium]